MNSVGDFYKTAYKETRPYYLSRIKEIQVSAECVEELLIKTFPACTGLTLCCSMERLDTAITSYFYDIHRYKHFHGMLDIGKESKINFAKIYAFTAKWLLKERPFYLRLDKSCKELPAPYLKYANYINELIFLYWLKASFKKLFNKDIVLSKKEEQKMRYSLKYREVSTSFLELFLLTKFPEPPKEKEALKANG